jgi:hypothetical protein
MGPRQRLLIFTLHLKDATLEEIQNNFQKINTILAGQVRKLINQAEHARAVTQEPQKAD